jgi:class 3 adenylate cyclase
MTIVGALVAGLVWRSRLQIGRILRAEAGREKARTERAFIRQTFGKYVPEAVASAILSDRGRLTPLKRRATVMFVDIEKFTGFSETLDADGVLTVVNAYFDAAGEVITANGGVINQFQGDAFIASFNVPIPDPDHAKRAVEAAESLFELVGRQHFAGQSVAIRIGLHTGEVAAGAIGSADRLSYTVIGHTVNVAARLEELNKEMGTRLLMTEATLAASGASDAYRQIGDWPLRGMSSPIGVYGR